MNVIPKCCLLWKGPILNSKLDHFFGVLCGYLPCDLGGAIRVARDDVFSY